MSRRWLTLSLVCMVAVAGCGSAKKDSGAVTTTSSSTTASTAPTGLPPALALTPVATFDAPMSMAQRIDNPAIYIAERAGFVRELRDGVITSTPVLDISADVSTDGERGLLGLAFSPKSPLLYVYFTDKTGTIHLTEFALDAAGVADPTSRRDLLTIEHQRSNHNGGQLAFGPDGLLYVGVGDGGGSGDPDQNAQNLTVLLGKILRINPTATTNAPYTVPFDNPFAKQLGARGEIWAYGVRNPWRFSFDSSTGGLWIGDVGQDKFEEINFVAKDPKGGQNYGWPLREGLHAYGADKPTTVTDPVYEYPHANGACSVTGGYVYRGKAIESLRGRYVFGDFCNGSLSTLTQNGTKWNADVLNVTVPSIVSFGEDHDGELYALAGDGKLLRFDAA